MGEWGKRGTKVGGGGRVVVRDVVRTRVGRYKIIDINYIYKMANFNYIL